MALDAYTLELCAMQLKEKLLDAKIDKIYQPTRDEVVITIRTRTQTHKLFVSARSGSARVCLTVESFENPSTPPSFCMLLRKHFTGGRLVQVRVVQGERIAFFDFLCTNEMGDQVTNTIAAELMGRYSNIVLINMHGKIIDALKRVDFDDSEVRQLLPGLAYVMPPMPQKALFCSVSPQGLVAAAKLHDTDIAQALMKSASGIGPVVCREAVFRAFGAQHVSALELTAEQAQQLCNAIAEIQADYNNGGAPSIAFSPQGIPVEFSFTKLTQYGVDNLQAAEDFSVLLERYYAVKDKAERLRQKSKELHKTVRNLYERSVRKHSARREELSQSEKADGLRICGELINANLFAMEKGAKSIELFNWYTSENETIKLDPRLSPSQNSQKYFKEYKKKQTAALMLVKLLQQGEAEIKYLETVLYEVENADGEVALSEIRQELKGQGYLKYYKVRDKKQKPTDFYRYTSKDGFLILVGRNNIQNEKLTLKTARGKDLWFHVKNAPGSHVIVMSEGKDIPNDTKNQAAQLAVIHSSQNGGAKVAVDYTQVRNIKKTGDLPPGMVIYDTNETAYITVDPTDVPQANA